MENSAHAFLAGGRRWLVVALELGPRPDVLRWAGEVLASKSDHDAVLLTHVYLDGRGRRFRRDRLGLLRGYPLGFGIARP